VDVHVMVNVVSQRKIKIVGIFIIAVKKAKKNAKLSSMKWEKNVGLFHISQKEIENALNVVGFRNLIKCRHIKKHHGVFFDFE